jgi:hypothetical protein
MRLFTRTVTIAKRRQSVKTMEPITPGPFAPEP